MVLRSDRRWVIDTTDTEGVGLRVQTLCSIGLPRDGRGALSSRVGIILAPERPAGIGGLALKGGLSECSLVLSAPRRNRSIAFKVEAWFMDSEGHDRSLPTDLPDKHEW